MTRLFLMMIASSCMIAGSGYFFMNRSQEAKQLTDQIRKEAPGKFIRLKHGKVHYLLRGSDTSELVVLIHGGGTAGIEVWEKNIPYLMEKGYRVLAFDLYGRGYSARPRLKNSPELFNEQLVELLDSLRVSGPFNIMAMSMGAIVALDYAQENPDQVKEVVLIDPSATGDYNSNPLLKLPVVSNFLLTVIWYPRAVENQRKEFVDQVLFDKYAKRLDYFMGFEGYKFTNYSTWMNMLNQNKLEQFNPKTQIPVLLIYGRQDPYFNADLAARYISHIPDIEVVQVQNAGHMPHYERPEEVNPIVYKFLTEESTR